MTGRPTIRQGDVGTDVKDLLNMLPTYYFDQALTNAVENYQRSRNLDVDGVVGPDTWNALESNAPPYVPPGLPSPLTPQEQADIEDIAASSAIAGYDWEDRGQAPIGYTKGIALVFANAYRQFKVQYPPAIEMAKANTHNSDKDALSWYAGIFNELGMNNDQPGADTLRHLFVLVMGLGMRESSGVHCEGRDTSVPVGYYGPPSTTTEAGAWQTSFDAVSCSVHCQTLFDAFSAGAETNNPQGFLDPFKEGVSCSSSQWQCYGDGNGYLHQEMSKYQPAYAAEFCAVVLRNLRQHYGPINRHEAEIKHEADVMLREVQAYINHAEGNG
jgi:peptidoglycan hydrolase-like protein with peptidoglycan-binding domain